MVNEELILFAINSLIGASLQPVTSINELQNANHFIEIISAVEARQFPEADISIPALTDSTEDKFEFILQYLSKQSTCSIMEWNLNELVHGNDVLLFKLHMIKTVANDAYQLNVDACLQDAAKRKCVDPLISDSNGSRNNNNHSLILDESCTCSTNQSQIGTVSIQSCNAIQEDVFKIQNILVNINNKYGDLEKRYNTLKRKHHELNEKVVQQIDYDIIKDERNQLREDIRRYEVENKQ
ncbi:unnamed protein product [Rotaria sordida]|uniref:Nuclear mitotic apparatus protein 1 N-terminal hook domain-containing protein n=1 Tax=Rotaria sordida TaxID=392033 RepID=A0A813NHH7_9BILA|nr:unnamed protein product [Rotaria sordida]CAF1072617.1 unnamed protein product [Rotaria sordida]